MATTFMWVAPGTRKVMNFDDACCGAHSANKIDTLARYLDGLAVSKRAILPMSSPTVESVRARD
jgi:hypothetical protein